MSHKDHFLPAWCEQEAPPRSWRSLFKYADPRGFKHPNAGMYRLLKDTFGMTDDHFRQPSLCMEDFDLDVPSGLAEAHVKAFKDIVGESNVLLDTYTRTKASYGGGLFDALRLRKKIVENLPGAVVCPGSRAELEKLVKYCHENRIPVYAAGGNSSVTRGKEAVEGGICIDMSRHLDRVLELNEEDQEVTVEAGIWGPRLEKILNDAPRTFKARRGYTVGHFPQSFLQSSVGGWIVTRGAGQNSTYYGKIEDMVIAQEYVTPIGDFKTLNYPRSATGPDFDQIMIGSEGTFGILYSATLRLCRYQPQNTRYYGFLFKTWEDGVNACREVMQGEFGFPSVFRLSDPEETDVGLRMYHVHGTPADILFRRLGYQPMQRCLMLGTCDGERDFARLVEGKLKKICKSYGAFDLTPFKVAQSWEKSRFTDPYMREDLMDYGVLIDTLECAVTWESMRRVHEEVRAVIKARPKTICMTHLSHAYPQGGNLYFIFVARMSEINEYLELQYSVLEAILKAGAAMSHHHGMGKQTSPWFVEQIGRQQLDVVRVLRDHFDPHHIMNPGGTLGLDMTEEQMSKRWGLRK